MARLLRSAAPWLGVLLALACSGPEESREEIRALQREGRFAESVAPLRALLDRDPSDPEINLMLGRALLFTGQAGLAVWPLHRASESPELAVDAGILMARAMLDSRTAPDAIPAIDRVLALDAENVLALTLRAEAYLATGRLDEALADIDRVLELDPDNLNVLLPRVKILIGSGRIDEAEAALEAAREGFASSEREVSERLLARLCIARALFAFEKGDRETAETGYAGCLEEFPSDPLVVFEAVGYYDRTERSERATEVLREALEESGWSIFRGALATRMGALGNPDEQEQLLRQEAEESSSWLAWFALAELYLEREDLDSALAAFEKSLAATPSPSSKLRFAYADTLVQAQQYAKARAVLEELDEPALRELIRGRLLLAEGDPQGALAAFDAGIRLWPNNPGGRFLAGQAAERVGDFERASSEYRESLRADPSQSEAGLALARLSETHGELLDALDAVGHYLRSHPDDPEAYLVTIRIAHRVERHAIAAEALERLGRLPGQAAVAIAEEAALVAESRGAAAGVESIEAAELDLRDPANAAALDRLLSLLASLGQHERAEGIARRAAEAHPDEAAFHALRGRALRAAGQPDGARRGFERALELDPESPQALAGLAELTAEAGDRETALALYDRLAAAAPDDPAPARAAALLLLDAGETADAERRLQRLLQRHPREGAAALALAELAAARGEHEQALALAKRAAWLRTSGAEAALARIRRPALADPEPGRVGLIRKTGRVEDLQP